MTTANNNINDDNKIDCFNNSNSDSKILHTPHIAHRENVN